MYKEVAYVLNSEADYEVFVSEARAKYSSMDLKDLDTYGHTEEYAFSGGIDTWLDDKDKPVASNFEEWLTEIVKMFKNGSLRYLVFLPLVGEEKYNIHAGLPDSYITSTIEDIENGDR